jgi:hypothetical protein
MKEREGKEGGGDLVLLYYFGVETFELLLMTC